LVKNPNFKKLLITYSNLYRVALRASLFKPRGNKRNIIVSSSLSCSLVERFWSPVKVDSINGLFIIKRFLIEYRFNTLWELEAIEVFVCQLKVISEVLELVHLVS
jgi:hypothetical protein